MKVVEWEIGRVRPYEKNPRIIPEEAVERVAASIREFGFQQPIVVDKDGVIIVGHTRLKAAEKLGLEKVPVVVLDLFGGSGTTLIACEQLGRKCRMMELDPHYCQVIIERWEALTGEKAEKIA